MTATTTPGIPAYDGEVVEGSAAGGTVVGAKEGARQAEAIGATNVSSIVWAMDNRSSARGTVTRNFRFPAPVIVNATSQVAVTVCERDGNGNLLIGDAHISVLDVTPRNDGSIDVRWHVGFDSLLPVRLDFVIVN